MINLATTCNQVKDLTGTIDVASIQRYYVAVNVTKAVERTTWVGEKEWRRSRKAIEESDLHMCTIWGVL